MGNFEEVDCFKYLHLDGIGCKIYPKRCDCMAWSGLLWLGYGEVERWCGRGNLY